MADDARVADEPAVPDEPYDWTEWFDAEEPERPRKSLTADEREAAKGLADEMQQALDEITLKPD